MLSLYGLIYRLPLLLIMLGFGLGLAITASNPLRAQDETELWAALQERGHFVLMRHALAPGTGDPSNFDVDDCSTQRNLSEAGRRQSRRTGEAFRANGIESAAALIRRSCWVSAP